MILDVRPDMAFVFRPLIVAMCEQEAARGDNLDPEEIMARLEAGHSQLLSFTEGPDSAIPLLLLLVRGFVDPLRDRAFLWVYNLFVPSPERLYEKWDCADGQAFVNSYPGAEIQFQTSNPAVVGMIEKLGLTATALHTVYRLGV
jgi:hypothetical protein